MMNSYYKYGAVSLVVLIAALLAAHFSKPPPRPSNSACITLLRQLQDAKQRWAVDHHKTPTDTPKLEELVGPDKYLKQFWPCPAGGRYTIGSMSVPPVCSILTHTLQIYGPSGLDELTCLKSLSILQVAKREWMHRYPNQGAPTEKMLHAYMNQEKRLVLAHYGWPVFKCEAGGHFIIGNAKEPIRCSIPGHTLPQ